MKIFVIVVVHDDIKQVSDRTLRDFLKELSRTVRRVQLDEIKDLLRDGGFDDRTVQSLADELKSKSETFPVYYLQRIEKGSLHADLQLGLAFLGAVLAAVSTRVGIDLVTKNKFYKRFMDYIEGKRHVDLAKRLAEEMAGKHMGGHFVVGEVSFTETRRRVIVNVELTTLMEFEQKLHTALNEEQLVASLRAKIHETEPQ